MTKNNIFQLEALTYDDVLLVPAYSEIFPGDTNVSTLLTKNIKLNIPFVSASMDTVTEHKLAIAIALKGGIGIIHKNMTIRNQAEQIRQVKRSQSGMIKDPITLDAQSTVGDAQMIVKKNKIGGIPIIDASNNLIGIVTNRDLRFQKDQFMKLDDIMTKKLITAKLGISLDEAEKILKKHKIEKLPIVEEGQLVGLITYKDILKNKSMPDACKDNLGRLRVGAALGVTDDYKERLERLITSGVDVIAIDTAHAHTKSVIDQIKKIKKNFDIDLIVGNIATGEAAKALVKAGADGIKVGVGPGSICTTRIIAGVGMPQLSAVYESTKAIKGSGIPVIADGGIRFSGDLAKAIGAGADTIMIGSLLAGTEESPGETFLYQGRTFKSYRGMGSLGAMARGSADRYFQQEINDQLKLVPEGVEGRVPYKGKVSSVTHQMVGGLRAAMGYTGNTSISQMKNNCIFQKVSSAGVRESHIHDIAVTKEAPNYKTGDN